MEKDEKKQYIQNMDVFPGFPVDYESDEAWRKGKYSCSGSGRIEKRFDLKNFSMLNIGLNDE